MGHYCRICHSTRPNEAFSGHGHKVHVCKRCRRMPAAQLRRIQALDEIDGFLDQSRISDKNLLRLGVLALDADPQVRERAAVLLEIGRATPYRRRRFRVLGERHRGLIARFRAAWGESDDALEVEQACATRRGPTLSGTIAEGST